MQARGLLPTLISLALTLAAPSCATKHAASSPAAGRGADATDAAVGGSGGHTGIGASGGHGGKGVAAECLADFPCNGRLARCVGAQQLQPYREASCHELCGDRPCTGHTCLPDGDIIDCPEGLFCRELATGAGTNSAQCMQNSGAAICQPDLDAGVDLDASMASTNDAGACVTHWGCGDGQLDPSLLETCDDGNRTDGDGCDRNCKREARQP